jgi:hypothetical protein
MIKTIFDFLGKLFLAITIWYLIFSFIQWDIYIQNWSGISRLFFILFTVGSWGSLIDKS